MKPPNPPDGTGHTRRIEPPEGDPSKAAPAQSPERLGDFRITREVGRGGMGVVYEAEQISLGRRVALKVLHLGTLPDAVAMQRFQREAETVARLHHTNIVPIFAVGGEQGTRYYAMQFIAGRDLADILEAARQAGTLIAAETVTRWGLQAAEALAHAHARGVIHRDIKPSNLLLDAEGRIWLTDFGLARREGDVALSAAGALLGTPRYMSPEQARGASEQVDHRSDVYSLGATLYELATGRPIFDATTTPEVLWQILHTEPRPPRQVAPESPRDLETIVLKCLAKDPAHRYATAQALADDLRAHLEGRAIAARPASLPERAVRWFRRHRRTTTVAAFSAGISLVLAVGGYLLWQDRQQARLGRLALTTDSPNLLGEVVDEAGRAQSPAFPVPTPEPVDLPAGRHYLRLSASGVLSQTWPIEIIRRQDVSRFVQLTPNWLWPPSEVNAAEHAESDIVTFDSHADLLVLLHATIDRTGTRDVRRLRRIDGASGRPVWPSDLIFDESSLPAGGDLESWKALPVSTGLEWMRRHTGLAERMRDLDGDGVGDPVLVSRTTPSLLAVSGQSGRVLWWAMARPSLAPAGGPGVTVTNGLTLSNRGRGFVVGLPLVADADLDGVPDFIACFHSNGDTYLASDGGRFRTGAQNWLGAVSGRTGAELWRTAVDENWSQYVNSSIDAEKFQARCRPVLARVDGRTVVLLVEQSNLLGVDARTGRLAWARLALGFEPDGAPDVVGADGDGSSKALFLRMREGTADDATSPTGRTRWDGSKLVSLSLTCVPLPNGAAGWEKAFVGASQGQANEFMTRRRSLYEVIDLDADGRQEVIVAGGQRSLRGGTRLEFEVWDASTGNVRWRRLLWAQGFLAGPVNVDQFKVGPDLDGDGHRDLFVAWGAYDASHGKPGLFVAAMSGASGAVLWRVHQPGVGVASALAWWHAGADGWPLLLASTGRTAGGNPSTLILSAGSGRLEHTLPDVREPRVADFDGDGILDLFYTLSPQGAPRNLMVKGTTPDAWRQLGDWQAAADFNADGFTDLLGIADAVLTARSGRNGQILWRAQSGSPDAPMESPKLSGDFDADGVPDVIAAVSVRREIRPKSYATIRRPAAFSGNNGRVLWVAENLDIYGGNASSSGSMWSYHYPLLDAVDLDRDRSSELIALQPASGSLAVLSVVSGRDGRVIWSNQMARGSFALNPSPAGKPLGDFNGDQTLDIAMWGPALSLSNGPASVPQSDPGAMQLMAFDGRTGRPLWPESNVTVSQAGRLIWPEPTVADLDGDGLPEAMVTRHSSYDSRRNQYRCELIAVDGRDGRIRWTWSWSSESSGMWPPIVLQPGKGSRPFVCLAFLTNSVPTLVSLDSDGRERFRRRLNLGRTQFDNGRQIWRAFDPTGNGDGELLFLDQGRLCAGKGERLDVSWQWPLPIDTMRLVDAQVASSDQPATLTIWSGKDAYGIDASTGVPLWRCGLTAAPQTGGSDIPEVSRLTVPKPDGPRVQRVPSPRAANSPASVVRQAWPVDRTGRYAAPHPAPRNYSSVIEIAVPGRALPWAESETVWVFSGAITFLVAGVPGLLVALAIRRRSWLFGLLPLGYAGAGLLLPWCTPFPALIVLGYAGWLGVCAVQMRRWHLLVPALVYGGLAGLTGVLALQGPSPGQGRVAMDWLRSLSLVLMGAPALAFWLACGWAVRRWRWNLLGGVLGASILMAILAGAMALRGDLSERALDERYSWHGAHFIWFTGITMTGMVVVVVVGGRWLLGRIRRTA